MKSNAADAVAYSLRPSRLCLPASAYEGSTRSPLHLAPSRAATGMPHAVTGQGRR